MIVSRGVIATSALCQSLCGLKRVITGTIYRDRTMYREAWSTKQAQAHTRTLTHAEIQFYERHPPFVTLCEVDQAKGNKL